MTRKKLKFVRTPDRIVEVEETTECTTTDWSGTKHCTKPDGHDGGHRFEQTVEPEKPYIRLSADVLEHYANQGISLLLTPLPDGTWVACAIRGHYHSGSWAGSTAEEAAQEALTNSEPESWKYRWPPKET